MRSSVSRDVAGDSRRAPRRRSSTPERIALLADLTGRLAARAPLDEIARAGAEALVAALPAARACVRRGDDPGARVEIGAANDSAGAAAACDLDVRRVPLAGGELELVLPAGKTPLDAEASAFLDAVSATLAASLERARLAAALARARDEERARLSRELHDGPAQAVGAAKLEVERLAARHPDAGLAPLAERLDAAFAELRALARALAPPALEALGLRGALRRLAEDLGRRAATRATYAERGPPRPLPRELEWNLLRIAEEAVANVARHARAASASVELSFDEGGVRLAIADDGRGFADAPDAPDAPRAGGSGMGLLTIRERARALGARLTLSSAPGEGTRIEVAAPARAAPASAPAVEATASSGGSPP